MNNTEQMPPPVIKPKSKPRLVVSVAAKFTEIDYKRMKVICEEESISPSELIRQSVRQKLNKKFYT